MFYTGSIDLVFNSDGLASKPSIYARPTPTPLGSSFVHFWLSSLGDVRYPAPTDLAVGAGLFDRSFLR